MPKEMTQVEIERLMKEGRERVERAKSLRVMNDLSSRRDMFFCAALTGFLSGNAGEISSITQVVAGSWTVANKAIEMEPKDEEKD